MPQLDYVDPVAVDGFDPDVSGDEAYFRYGRVAMSHVMRRGGRLVFLGWPEPLLVGASGHPLDLPWDGFALVFYPSRLAMRDMLAAESYRAAIPHREAAVERAILMPGTPAPAYVPGAE